MIRIFIDCVGSYRVEQELEESVLAVWVLMVFLLTAAMEGVTHLHLKQCPPTQGSPSQARPNSHPGSAAQLHHYLQHTLLSFSGSALHLSSKINCSQIFLPAT